MLQKVSQLKTTCIKKCRTNFVTCLKLQASWGLYQKIPKSRRPHDFSKMILKLRNNYKSNGISSCFHLYLTNQPLGKQRLSIFLVNPLYLTERGVYISKFQKHALVYYGEREIFLIFHSKSDKSPPERTRTTTSKFRNFTRSQ